METFMSQLRNPIQNGQFSFVTIFFYESGGSVKRKENFIHRIKSEHKYTSYTSLKIRALI